MHAIFLSGVQHIPESLILSEVLRFENTQSVTKFFHLSANRFVLLRDFINLKIRKETCKF